MMFAAPPRADRGSLTMTDAAVVAAIIKHNFQKLFMGTTSWIEAPH
jgi:hypothetical protein